MIVLQRFREQQGIVKHVLVVAFDLRFREQAGRKGAVRERRTREKIQAALYEIIVPEGLIVRERLEPQIAEPQPSVPLGTVFKDLLHALPEGRAGDFVDPVKQRVTEMQLFRCFFVRTRCCLAGDFPDLQGEAAADPPHLDPQITECVAARKADLRRQHVDAQFFLLDPGGADPAAVIFQRFRQFRQPFGKAEPQPDRGIRMVPFPGKHEPDPSGQMLPEIICGFVSPVQAFRLPGERNRLPVKMRLQTFRRI